MIGIQVGAVSFVDEGTDQVLDIFQEKAGDQYFVPGDIHLWARHSGTAGPGQPLPDHGKQEYDLDFHGGNYGTVHTQYYKDTGVDPTATRAPDHGNLDIIAEVLPKAKEARHANASSGPRMSGGMTFPGIEKLAGSGPVRAKDAAGLRKQSLPPEFSLRAGGRLHALLRH